MRDGVCVYFGRWHIAVPIAVTPAYLTGGSRHIFPAGRLPEALAFKG